jgi:hypothetical protein
MPRQATEEDYKRDFLILLLIFEITGHRDSFEYADFHDMALRYIAELEERGMTDLSHYIDVVSGRSQSAEEGLFEAMKWDYVSRPSEHGRFVRTYSDSMKYRRLVRQKDLTPDEWFKAEDAAKATFEAFLSGTLRDKQPAVE